MTHTYGTSDDSKILSLPDAQSLVILIIQKINAVLTGCYIGILICNTNMNISWLMIEHLVNASTLPSTIVWWYDLSNYCKHLKSIM